LQPAEAPARALAELLDPGRKPERGPTKSAAHTCPLLSGEIGFLAYF